MQSRSNSDVIAKNNPPQNGAAPAPPGDTDKRALLRRLLAEKPFTIHPLSYAQERIWFTELLNPNTSTEHILQVARLEDRRLEREILERCLELMLERHNVLRARIVERGGRPRQIIDAKVPLSLEYLDFTALDPVETKHAIRSTAHRLFDEPFDMSRPPLMRVALAENAKRESLIFLVMHHIIADDDSVKILFREIKQAYAALSAGQHPTFASAPTSYGKFCEWQRAAVEDERRIEQLRYWREQLTGMEPLEVPADFPRNSGRVNKAERLTRVLSTSLSERLRARLRAENVTAFMLTLAAFKAVLARYTGRTDIAVGTPITGRNSEDLSGSVGPYMNDLVLRTDVSGDPSLHELIQRVRQTSIRAFANQDIPFEQIVEELRPPRESGRHPFFDILFLFLRDLSTEISELEAISVGQATAKLDLSQLVIEESSGFTLIFEYSSGLFERRSIEHMASLMHWVLEQIAEDPSVRLSELTLSTGAETTGDGARQLPPGDDPGRDDMAYWKRQLAGAPPLLSLPTDWPRPMASGTESSLQRRQLDSDLAARLTGFAYEQGVSILVLLLASFQALLSRYSEQRDILVGTPVPRKSRIERDLFVETAENVLVIRTDVAGELTFLELLDRVKSVVLESFAHDGAGFNQLVQQIVVERSSSYAPLIQVLFAFEDARQAGSELEGVDRQLHPLVMASPKLDLSLIARAGGVAEGISATFEYRADLFDPSTIRMMGDHWISFLRNVLENPETPVDLVPFEKTNARHIASGEAIPRDIPFITDWIDRRSQEQPTAVALIDGDVRLSYQQLTDESNRLARHLGARGVGCESIVGVSIPRSVDQVVAMLAVLKSGAAYVSLDTDHPQERLASIVEDSGISLILTDTVESPFDNSLCIGSLVGDMVASHPTVHSENLAYLIYTSGSTGRPKGVMISHGSLINQTQWMGKQFNFGPRDCVLYKASAGFDASLVENLIPLALGCSVVIVPPGRQYDVEYLADRLESHRVTYLDVGPTLLESLMAHERLQSLPDLRIVTCGGESLPIQLAKVFEGRMQGTLFNTYGPTETTIQSTFWDCRNPFHGTSVPIGEPISNTQCYVLGNRMQPTPAGVVGELYIGGVGVARGYWKQPALTADRFVPDPFDPSGGRLYRTGDLVRRRATGELEFVRRVDEQIKLRGFRIELGEIEAALQEIRGVRTAVAALRQDAGPAPFIAAYLIKSFGVELPSAVQLRAALGKRLPDYMMPSTFTEIDAIPLNTNGKVDRKRLPKPEMGSHAWEFPRPGIEQLIALVWETLLHAERVGRNDNFFELGGHSLLATQLVSRIRTELRIEVPLRRVFEYPTLADFAQAVESERRIEDSARTEPELQSVDRSSGTFVSFAQRRLWLLSQLEPRSSAYNVPLVIRIAGQVDAARLERAIVAMIERNEALRSVFEQGVDEPLQRVASGDSHPLQRMQAGSLEEAQSLAAGIALEPFELDKGPLTRWVLIQYALEGFIFLITIHHIVIDGWSMNILLEELAATYGTEEPKSRLPIQYGDFCQWQRLWLTGERLEHELRYWRDKLSGAPTLLSLPTDRTRPSSHAADAKRCHVKIDRELLNCLRNIGNERGATLFMVLLASFQVLLSRYTGQEDFLIGTPIAGRNRSELEAMIGFFVNTLILRSDLSGDPDFLQLLDRVKETCLEAYGHQEAPFELLVEAIAPERTLAYSPVVQVMLTLDTAIQSIETQGLHFEVEDLNPQSAKFDLTLAVRESENGIFCSFEYRADIFESDTVNRMADDWKQILHLVVANPAESIHTLPYLFETDQIHRDTDTDSASSPLARLPLVVKRVADRAGALPNQLALIDDREQLNYDELNRESNKVARFIHERGVKTEQVVAVRMRRSCRQIVTLFGIMKAGAAYLPIDPDYPEERVSFMLEDSLASIMFCEEEDECKDSRYVHYDETRANSPEPLGVEVLLGNLAYLIYTSGSTGRPKGVMVSHGSLANLVQWHIDAFELHSWDRGMCFAGLGFDASVWEIWPYLSMGASLAIPREEVRFEPSRLRDWILSQSITACFVPTPIAEQLIDLDWPGQSKLRVLLTGGDRLMKRSTDSVPWQLWNNYGPTETTVVATSGLVAPQGKELPSIGHAIANTRCYVLNARMRPVPIGVVGELYVGGAGVARGYWKKPELTAERFLPNPFGSHGDRMYRTGDLVRLLETGELEFIGRADEQIKVRGFRVELGDIESALQELDGVGSVVAALQQDGAPAPFIAAYLVKSLGKELPSSRELRTQLAERLPDYMIPSVFMEIKALPLNPNGKVDRRRLPKPELETRTWEPPRPGTEHAVAMIWEELLERERIDRRDNFFELGGYSLLAAQAIARLRVQLGVTVQLAAFFRSPCLVDFATEVNTATVNPKRSPLIVLRHSESSTEPIVLIHAIGGSILSYLNVIEAIAPGRSIVALQPPAIAELIGLKTIEELAAHYSKILMEGYPAPSYQLVGWSFAGLVALEMSRCIPRETAVTLIDTHLPSQEDAVSNDMEILRQFAQHVRRKASVSIVKLLDFLEAQASAGTVTEAWKIAQTRNLGWNRSDVMALEHSAAVFAHNQHLYSRFEPRYFPGHVTLIRAEESAPATWDKWIPDCDVRILSGDHDTILEAPQASQVAAILENAGIGLKARSA